MRSIEGVAYYLSAMTLFNSIYALRVFGLNWANGQFITVDNLFAFIISVTLAIVGFVFTLLICSRDHTIKNRNTLGKTVKVAFCEDITGDNFFSRYSILVLTGCSLPILSNFVGLTIYLLVLCTLGAVFVRQEMYYLNPIIVLMRYKIVKAKCNDKDKIADYYFVYQRGSITCGDEINFLNVNNKIIRLKDINYEQNNQNAQLIGLDDESKKSLSS